MIKLTTNITERQVWAGPTGNLPLQANYYKTNDLTIKKKIFPEVSCLYLYCSF